MFGSTYPPYCYSGANDWETQFINRLESLFSAAPDAIYYAVGMISNIFVFKCVYMSQKVCVYKQNYSKHG